MLEDINEKDIKKVSKIKNKIFVDLSSQIEIDEERLKHNWQSLKRREEVIVGEKEKLMKIAHLAKIKLE